MSRSIFYCSISKWLTRYSAINDLVYRRFSTMELRKLGKVYEAYVGGMYQTIVQYTAADTLPDLPESVRKQIMDASIQSIIKNLKTVRLVRIWNTLSPAYLIHHYRNLPKSHSIPPITILLRWMRPQKPLPRRIPRKKPSESGTRRKRIRRSSRRTIRASEGCLYLSNQMEWLHSQSHSPPFLSTERILEWIRRCCYTPPIEMSLAQLG